MRRNHAIYGSVKLLMALLARVPTLVALPTSALLSARSGPERTGDRQQLYTFLGISIVLVFLGGAFAGLTLGLMGQDEMYLKVISSSGTVAEQRDAKRVLKLIERGKHWVLVTLLLSNVITNETLPIVLDRCLGGGWQAVVMSTLLIVVFGEIIPQSVCVRYGLQVGAWCSPFVLALMYLMYPVAYPIAMLLDYILGEDHGTVYKKSGLKSLVMLHRTMGVDRLTHDEVTIISAVLDLKDKQVQEIMTPIENVFTISANKILDEKAVEEIFNSGFSRIPIYLPGQPSNFIGMLLVRVLISYDPADALPVSHFPLATLPETSPRTSCLNILNYFQEGKSHMCIVSQNPGASSGALGVLTLEDVIEELIGEEIVDESDVFVNIHQRIMREQPGPLSKRHITSYLHSLYTSSSRASAAAAAANGATVDGEPSSTDTAAYKKSGDGVRGSNSVSLPADRYMYNAGGHDPRVSAPDVIQPMNPAANPLNINNPHVTVKRHAPILQTGAAGANQSPLQIATTYTPGQEEPTESDDSSSAGERRALISIPNHTDYGGTANAPPSDLQPSHHYTSPGIHAHPISTVSTAVYATRSLSPSKLNPKCLSSDTSLQKDSDNTSEDNENGSFSASPDHSARKQFLFFSESSSKVVQSRHAFSSDDRLAYHESFKDSYLNNGIISTYRSTRNGIVESVITVEGVPKTIIEPALGWDDSNSTYLLSTNGPGYHYSGGRSEADNLDTDKKNINVQHQRRHSFSK